MAPVTGLVVTLFGVFALSRLASPVAADFGCAHVWKGPGTNNSITQCLTDYFEGYQHKIGPVVGIAIPMLVLLVVCFSCPFVSCARYLCRCCGGCNRRPGFFCCGGSEWDDKTEEEIDAAYTRTDVLATKISTVVFAIIGISACVLMVVGTSDLVGFYGQFWDGIFGIVAWADGEISGIQNVTSIGNGTFITGLDNSVFQNALNATESLSQALYKYKQTPDSYIPLITAISDTLGAAPYSLLLVGVVFAFLNVRKFGPCVLNCFLFLFVIVYGLFGFFFVGLGYGDDGFLWGNQRSTCNTASTGHHSMVHHSKR